MSRLTELNRKTINGKYVLKDKIWGADAIQKLGEYEDTDLTPNEINDLKNALTKISTLSNIWISCKEKMPEPGTTVLVYTNIAWSPIKVATWTINHRWVGARTSDISHWMYLPKIPE